MINFPVSASCVTISDPDSLSQVSSSETGFDPGIIAELALIRLSSMSKSHWYPFQKEVKSWEPTTLFKVWQFQTLAEKRYLQIHFLDERFIFREVMSGVFWKKESRPISCHLYRVLTFFCRYAYCLCPRFTFNCVWVISGKKIVKVTNGAFIIHSSQKRASLAANGSPWVQAGQISIEDMFMSSMVRFPFFFLFLSDQGIALTLYNHDRSFFPCQTGKCLDFTTTRLVQVCKMHKELCGVLLSAYEALDRTVKMLAEYAPIVSRGGKAGDDTSGASSSSSSRKKNDGSPIDSLAKLRNLNNRLTVSLWCWNFFLFCVFCFFLFTIGFGSRVCACGFFLFTLTSREKETGSLSAKIHQPAELVVNELFIFFCRVHFFRFITFCTSSVRIKESYLFLLSIFLCFLRVFYNN